MLENLRYCYNSSFYFVLGIMNRLTSSDVGLIFIQNLLRYMNTVANVLGLGSRLLYVIRARSYLIS